MDNAGFIYDCVSYKYTNTSSYIFERLCKQGNIKMYPNVLKCNEIYWNELKWFEMYWSVLKCIECIEMYWNVSKCIEMYWNVLKCIEMYRNVPKCFETNKKSKWQKISNRFPRIFKGFSNTFWYVSELRIVSFAPQLLVNNEVVPRTTTNLDSSRLNFPPVLSWARPCV